MGICPRCGKAGLRASRDEWEQAICLICSHRVYPEEEKMPEEIVIPEKEPPRGVNAPHGYRRLRDGTLVEDEEEQQVLALIKKGMAESKSPEQIRVQLELGGYTNRFGKPFTAARVGQIRKEIQVRHTEIMDARNAHKAKAMEGLMEEKIKKIA